MPSESVDTARICLGAGAQTDEAGMRRLKQIGVDHVLMSGPRIPWNEADLRNLLDRFRAGGLTVCNLMISGFDDVIWGRPGAEALPPREGVGTHTRADQLKRAEHFLKAVVPEAEKANVRLALHPNDPPVPISRGSEQMMATFEHWKEYLRLVDSPCNGMTFDCGVTSELGEDPVAVCRYLGERDRIRRQHRQGGDRA